MRSLTSAEALGPLSDKERTHAPATLYLEGDTTLLKAPLRVAVVGARSVSEDGVRRATKLARELVGEGVTLVSGLARGIDSHAHETAIETGGCTIAVLGTPLDRVYPPEHTALQREIGRDHLLVSQFAPGTPVSRGNFPKRNRTIALVADAAVIVEAGAASGTVSLGWEALRLGRSLFLMASLLERGLRWPSQMVSHGALELRETQQVLDVLHLGLHAPTTSAL